MGMGHLPAISKIPMNLDDVFVALIMVVEDGTM
jgi:hypothetical protein